MPTDIDAQSDIDAAHPQAPIPPAKVLRAVDEIVNSRLFRTSPQCQKLLRYVVVHTLEGKEEELKERVIGSEVFGRAQDYNTSDDPVVRTRAADVRKRLAVFYLEEGAKAAIRITMPSGSYRVLLASLESSSSRELLLHLHPRLREAGCQLVFRKYWSRRFRKLLNEAHRGGTLKGKANDAGEGRAGSRWQLPVLWCWPQPAFSCPGLGPITRAIVRLRPFGRRIAATDHLHRQQCRVSADSTLH
jgi:hypothetical protein